MDVTTVTMPKKEARGQLERVRHVLRRRADSEYEALEAAYEALAEGTPVINLQDAILAAEWDGNWRPRLAVARADRKQVRFRWPIRTSIAEFDTRHSASSPSDSLRLTFDMGQEHQHRAPPRWRPDDDPVPSEVTGWALVPMIPPDVRAAHPASYDRRRFILWEVEEWFDERQAAKPPYDPMLLDPLGHGLYAVVAQWDLTELERMVMAGRRE